MVSSESIHLKCEEFFCLHLSALPCIPPLPVKGFLGLQGHHCLGFTVYPTIISQGISRSNQGYSQPSFTVYPIKGFQGLVINLKTTQPCFESSWQSSSTKTREPHHTMAIQKWQGKAKNHCHAWKTHANGKKRTKKIDACNMHAKNIKEIIHATWKL